VSCAYTGVRHGVFESKLHGRSLFHGVRPAVPRVFRELMTYLRFYDSLEMVARSHLNDLSSQPILSSVLKLPLPASSFMIRTTTKDMVLMECWILFSLHRLQCDPWNEIPSRGRLYEMQ
jgi:hypothetical protein